MTIRVLYFARLRDALGCAEETLPLTRDVSAVLAHLRERGGVWARELAPDRTFCIAVNHEVARLDTPLTEGAELAIFPPVTGG